MLAPLPHPHVACFDAGQSGLPPNTFRPPRTAMPRAEGRVDEYGTRNHQRCVLTKSRDRSH